MLVKFRTRYRVAGQPSHDVGEVVDVGEDEGRRLVDRGYATLEHTPEAKRARRKPQPRRSSAKAWKGPGPLDTTTGSASR